MGVLPVRLVVVTTVLFVFVGHDDRSLVTFPQIATMMTRKANKINLNPLIESIEYPISDGQNGEKY